MNAERFKMMKKTAILINRARGPIVDTMALNDALRSGTIAGAGLDVTDPEPIPMDHPLVTAPNCIIAPHIASGSVVTRNKMSEIAAGNIIGGLGSADASSGQPRGPQEIAALKQHEKAPSPRGRGASRCLGGRGY